MTTTTRVIVLPVQALGGGSPIRRALVACGVSAAIVAAASSPLRAVSDEQAVRVVEQHGLYHVTTAFVVPQPAALVTAVLTDYEHIPEFMTDVKISRVLERGAGRLVVEQEAVARFLFFSRRIHLALEIVETPGLIRFRDVCGKSFLRYEGAWRIDAEGARVRITYELAAQPTADIPAAIVRRLLSRDVQKTVEQLTSEIARRALARDLAPTR